MTDMTHDTTLTSWVASAQTPGCDFPIQNLPFGRFRVPGGPESLGVAIGDAILDLRAAATAITWHTDAQWGLTLLGANDMNAFMALPKIMRRSLREELSLALRTGSPHEHALHTCLVPQSQAQMQLPCHIGDYTDFYTGIHHATTVGKLFRPDSPLLPNYKWVPIGYHGRGSSIRVGPQSVKRPLGQLKGDAASPELGLARRLDYELEIGAFISQGNELGDSITMDQAEDALFGLCLLNDWSARDVQAWEYQPLGPFLSKSFATTISPWIVTMEALDPFRVPFTRPEGDPQPLAYLDSPINRERGGVDIQLEVWLQTAAMRQAGQPEVRLMRSNFRDAYWTLAQLVAHHTINGCNLGSGDLFGSGTQSGPNPGEGGSLLELSHGGQAPLTLPDGSRRTFLEAGDTVVMRAFCERTGAARIGFGEARGTIVG
ncbi:MAG: fumarylacetoacetase [Ideonella sp.]|nr:fumarylacetoacetase [Ideonella sp.]